MNSEDDQMEFDTAVCIPADNENELFSLQSFILFDNITISKVEEIEKELDFHEKFSLVFLLYDSSELELAYQKLEVAYTAFCKGDKTFSPVSQWAREHAGNFNWNERLIEALCIIQNYKLVHDLGYSKKDMNLKFLIDNLYISSDIDLMRKALYRVCEGLTLSKAEQLINRVYEDVTRDLVDTSISLKKYSPEFLEISFLYWNSLQYTTIGLSSVQSDFNIQKLASHLKVLEEEELSDYLKSIEKKCNSIANGRISLEPEPGNRISSVSPVQDHSIVSTTYGGLPDIRSVYSIKENSVGLCLIINQKHFFEDTDINLKPQLPHKKLETRLGTDIDEFRLIETFSALGFEICEVGHDLSHTEIIETVRTSAKKFNKEHSCFVLCILSHGKKDEIYGSNSIPVEIRELEDLISGRTYPNLFGKPKIIIIQACQGSDLQLVYKESDIRYDGLPHGRTPLHAEDRTRSVLSDQIKFWSTVPGFASFRHPQNGTWFIESLTSELLMQKPQMNVCDIFTNVNSRIGERKAYKDEMWVGMTPQWSSTLTKTLYLPLRSEARFFTARKMLLRHMFNTLLDEYIRFDISSGMYHHHHKASK